MKLNLDCIRSVLLVLENAPYQKNMLLGEIAGELGKKYSFEDISYSILKLHEAGYIKALVSQTFDGVSIVSVSDITYDGHQFLANIRSNNIWNNVKEVSKKVGSNSISALAQIATAIITDAIKSQVGLV